MIFDIELPGVSDGTVMHHTSIASPKPIKPYSLKIPGATLLEQHTQPCQLCILKKNHYCIQLLLFKMSIVLLNLS